MSSASFVCVANASFLNVAVYVVVPFASHVAAVFTTDVVLTVSVSTCLGSFSHTLVAVTLELSSAHSYVGSPQS